MKSILHLVISLCISLCGFSLLAQVGINTENPKTMLDINGNLALRGSALSLNNGNNNVVAGDHSVVNISGPTANFNINTIQPLADVDGQLITLVNLVDYSMTLVNNSGGAPNSLFIPGGRDLSLKGKYSTITLQYIKSMQRWMVVKYANGGDIKKSIYSGVLNTDVSRNSSTFAQMAPSMKIDFTPANPLVLVNVSLAGVMDALGADNEPSQGYADFRLVKVSAGVTTVVGGFTTMATDVDRSSSITAWNSKMAMYPVTVSPGVATSIYVEWRKAGKNPATLRCNPVSTPARSHGSITILD